MTVFPAADGGS